MTIQLFSIEQAPRALPIWRAILEDLGDPPPRRVAKVLGISERTVYRYSHDDRAPRVVLLALFWLTRWGQHQVHTKATNDALVACAYVESLRTDVAQLQAQLRRLSLPDVIGESDG